MFAHMQAVMFVYDSAVNFWWIKPKHSNPKELEQKTMTFNTSGPYKNDAGRSKQIYQPVADLFNHRTSFGNTRFDFEMVDGIPHAVLIIRRNTVTESGSPKSIDVDEKLYLVLIWQEEWSGIFARTKYLKGKMVFRRQDEAAFFARQFLMEGSKFVLSDADTDDFMDPFDDGSDDVKDLYEDL